MCVHIYIYMHSSVQYYACVYNVQDMCMYICVLVVGVLIVVHFCAHRD